MSKAEQSGNKRNVPSRARRKKISQGVTGRVELKQEKPEETSPKETKE